MSLLFSTRDASVSTRIYCGNCLSPRWTGVNLVWLDQLKGNHRDMFRRIDYWTWLQKRSQCRFIDRPLITVFQRTILDNLFPSHYKSGITMYCDYIVPLCKLVLDHPCNCHILKKKIALNEHNLWLHIKVHPHGASATASKNDLAMLLKKSLIQVYMWTDTSVAIEPITCVKKNLTLSQMLSHRVNGP